MQAREEQFRQFVLDNYDVDIHDLSGEELEMTKEFAIVPEPTDDYELPCTLDYHISQR